MVAKYVTKRLATPQAESPDTDDGSLRSLYSTTYCIRGDSLFDESREVSLVFFFIFFLEVPHVVGHVTSIHILSELVCFQLVTLSIITHKATRAVGNTQVSMNRSYEDKETRLCKMYVCTKFKLHQLQYTHCSTKVLSNDVRMQCPAGLVY